MDSVNNNTMSNNNNSSNVNNNVTLPVPCNSSDQNGSGNMSACATSNGATPSGRESSGSRRSTSSSRDSNSSSRRSHSSGRSRSRHRRSHGSSRRSSRHHSRQRHNKHRERNFPSALCSMVAIVILSTAMAEPRWIRIENGSCRVSEGKLTYLGAFQFLYNGHFVENVHTVSDMDQKSITVFTDYKYGPLESDCKYLLTSYQFSVRKDIEKFIAFKFN